MLFEVVMLCGLLYAGEVIGKKIALFTTKKRGNQTSDHEITLDEIKASSKKDALSKLSEDASTTKKHKVAVSEKEINRKLAVSAMSIVLSVTGELFYPPLVFLSIPGLLYASTDIFKNAYTSLIKEKSVNVDSTITVVTVVCIFKGFFFICNLNTFFAMLSRKLLLRIKDDSQNDIIDIFSQQPHKAWVLFNGVEVERPADTLKEGDIVVVNAGETIPVDGSICFGTCLIDQHILTGESQPTEKGPNEKVFALTLVLSGKIGIRCENAGQKTTAAQIGQILNQTTNLKTDMQLWSEETGNKAVLPLMLLSGVCLPVLGSSSSLAVLNSHPKYKTTITTYIGVLNFLSLASQKGILIKDGRVFELLNKVDTIVFDKTGTLTENRMYVDQIHVCEQYEEDRILIFAAIAEQKQTHPIARAILHEADARQLQLPESDETAYKVGYGLTVKKNNEMIRVGSRRFIESEGLMIPQKIREIQEFCGHQGHSLILVAVNERVIGGIELHAVVRQEAWAVVKGMRQRHINSVYIVSGDYEIPTKQLSDSLGTDRYFAEVLPEDKANLIEQFQKEGRTVCFVGDGINDSIALRKADVSISLRGASTVATDTAQIILMDESLSQFCYLFDLAKEYDSNMRRTFTMVLIPHLLGFGGALFLHYGLLHSVVFNQIGLVLGTGNAILPRIQQKHPVKDITQK